MRDCFGTNIRYRDIVVYTTEYRYSLRLSVGLVVSADAVINSRTYDWYEGGQWKLGDPKPRPAIRVVAISGIEGSDRKYSKPSIRYWSVPRKTLVVDENTIPYEAYYDLYNTAHTNSLLPDITINDIVGMHSILGG